METVGVVGVATPQPEILERERGGDPSPRRCQPASAKLTYSSDSDAAPAPPTDPLKNEFAKPKRRRSARPRAREAAKLALTSPSFISRFHATKLVGLGATRIGLSMR
jgi:hypothetical protein